MTYTQNNTQSKDTSTSEHFTQQLLKSGPAGALRNRATFIYLIGGRLDFEPLKKACRRIERYYTLVALYGSPLVSGVTYKYYLAAAT